MNCYIELHWPATGRSIVLDLESYVQLPCEAVARSHVRFVDEAEALAWFTAEAA